MVSRMIGYVTLLIRDYDEAIAYFTERLRFDVLEDKELAEDKRWVVVAPPGRGGTAVGRKIGTFEEAWLRGRIERGEEVALHTAASQVPLQNLPITTERDQRLAIRCEPKRIDHLCVAGKGL